MYINYLITYDKQLLKWSIILFAIESNNIIYLPAH